jgi:F0F1-type ATP synthase delta subunit
MKTKHNHLDVDFIQSRPLTKAEEKGLSEFIKKLKSKKRKLSFKTA